ncbi:protein FAM214A isoform X1 [Callorhinchus milii]|uniref:Atos homolog protein A n=1 Tax=Callorhinchus milii TaxID=7868 RepID=A0A4W3K013_CALMI|nr:protein FAM214A isoform X1 [Callorhinchus milii]XP_007904385.1 protein FAM214A isoform X1 [Callorhinchus milii]XP_007904402.1 protein FAM214A isoform X1 [Callorhinchus milii]XP_042199978.1 protein FAM214A isoform X1 [Callorhinchus milii]|eukprot:gi/632938267/ref/XP_007904377.1/ PREDICTED: protein FAM214A isoform X1 [Callorhinchus milii]
MISAVGDKADTIEEYFEYEAEEFLLSLSLLITEGRTPECSVKGRTEGFHCPPAQLGQSLTTKHECIEKLPQCCEARRTRSEILLLWRNNIPIMVEVMLLPDCCYSDSDGPSTEGSDINDPAIKQDALLLERWSLQSMSKQTGDRFIEEKSLLQAVRSYVFFSQLSAWLSASQGAVPRNILYRISAADEDMLLNFTQAPVEHVFPVPNITHSLALRVTVLSLPRQPSYPLLACSIHTTLSFYGKNIPSQEKDTFQPPIAKERDRCSTPGAQQKYTKQTFTGVQNQALLPSSTVNARKCPSEITGPSKAARLFLPLNSADKVSEVRNSQSKTPCCNWANAADAMKVQPYETHAVKTLKSFSATDSNETSSSSSHVLSGETNPLIGCLLQEREEVIARIAQQLNYCDPNPPLIAGSNFSTVQEPSSTSRKLFPGSYEEESLKNEALCSSATCTESNLLDNRLEEKSRTSSTHTPVTVSRKAKAGNEKTTCRKPQARRKLFLADTFTDTNDTAETEHLTERTVGKPDVLELSPTHYSSLVNRKCPKESGKAVAAEQNKVKSSCTVTLRKDTVNCTDILEHLIDRTCTKSCRDRKSSNAVADSDSQHVRLLHTHRDVSQLDKASACDLGQSDSFHLNNTNPVNWTDNDFNNAKNKPAYTECLNTQHSDPQSCPELSLSRSKSERNKLDVSSSLYIGTLRPIVNETVTSKTDQDRADLETQTRSSTQSTCSSTVPRKLNGDCKEKRGESQIQNKIVSKSPLKPCGNVWKKQIRRSLDGISTKVFHPCTGLPLLSSPVPPRKKQSGYFDLDASLQRLKGVAFRSPRAYLKPENDADQRKQLLSISAPPATSLSLLGNFEESVLNFRLEPLGSIDGFTAEVGASGTFCPSHLTLPVEVSFYSVSDDNAPSPYMGLINLESLGKRGYRVPPSGTIQVTLFNPNKTVVKMFVVIYDLRDMPANYQTFLRQRTFSVPVKREPVGHANKENVIQTEERILRYLIHLRFQSSKSGKIYLHRDVRLLFSRKSMEVDSGAAYELKSYTEVPTNPHFSPRC